MSEVDLSTPAPAAPPVETPAVSPAPELAPQQEQFIQVDRGRLNAAGYQDYHRALSDAQEFTRMSGQGVFTDYQTLQTQAERLGYGTVDALLAELATVNPEAAAAIAEGEPGAPTPSPMDNAALLDQLDERLNTRFQTERDRATQERTDADNASTEQRARGAENDFAMKALDELGIKMPEDANTFAPDFSKEFNSFFLCLQHVRQQGISPIMTESQQQQVLAGQATAAELTQAKELWSNTVKDADTKRVAALASKQELTPGATLAGGSPGGAPKQKPWEELTKAEQIAEVKRLNGL